LIHLAGLSANRGLKATEAELGTGKGRLLTEQVIRAASGRTLPDGQALHPSLSAPKPYPLSLAGIEAIALPPASARSIAETILFIKGLDRETEFLGKRTADQAPNGVRVSAKAATR
jgi:hypothetical protein